MDKDLSAANGNLGSPRAGRGVYVNVGTEERAISALAGAAILTGVIRSASLGRLALAVVGGGLLYRAVKGHCPAYSALGVDTARGTPAAGHDYFEHGIHVEETLVIDRTAADLYQFWRDFGNLPRFMHHVESVKQIDERRSRWTIAGPAGRPVKWDAEIINDVPNALIAWRSLGKTDVDNAGSVRFLPAEDGTSTEVRVVIDYIPPAGVVGKWVAVLLGVNPATLIREDLQRFKQLMESNEKVGPV